MPKGLLVKATLRFDGGHRRSIDKAAYGFTLKDAEGNQAEERTVVVEELVLVAC